MEPKLAALKAFLDELGLPLSISSLGDRKLIQKAVLLGQDLGGVDLGYRYGWYIRGPYSTTLAKSYYELDHAIRVDPHAKPQLPDSSARKLRRLRPLLQVPPGVNLDQPEWLELLASTQYLRKERRLNDAAVKDVLAAEKKHLVDYFAAAVRELKKVT